MKLSLVERETILLYNQAEPIRVWDYPNTPFSFSGKGPENPKNRKRVLACCACYRNPTFYFSLY